MDNAEEYQEIVEGILEGSPYRKKEADRKNYMSVAELGELLGLGKTERYWLLHKGYFKTTKVNGKNWIDISSFETWLNTAKWMARNPDEASGNGRILSGILRVCWIWRKALSMS